MRMQMPSDFPVERPGIEGNYEDIAYDLDEEMAHRRNNKMHGGVRNSGSHGIYYNQDNGMRARANVGLFSLCEDPGDKISDGSHICIYDYFAPSSWEARRYGFTEEELAHSHEIVF